jgi:hypothetical protein
MLSRMELISVDGLLHRIQVQNPSHTDTIRFMYGRVQPLHPASILPATVQAECRDLWPLMEQTSHRLRSSGRMTADSGVRT